ncbi:hypothetical protein [Olsenella sp. DNF00959]|uniref:hypothetical protein n=1 Tax=Olsenella TaxID=133925 RepID=UPI0007834D96|nr:hypothetical protein [Olsenella sp. DNF00959]
MTLLRLVAIEAGMLGPTRQGVASAEELDALGRLEALGARVVLLCGGGREELSALLGGSRDLAPLAVLDGGAMVLDGGRAFPPSEARGFEGAVGCLLATHGLGWEDAAFLGESAAGLGCMLRAGCSATCEDAPGVALEAARYVIGPRSEGSVASALGEFADGIEWGEEPSFVRREREGRPGLGDGEPLGEPRRGGVALLLLGLVVALAAGRFMLVSLERGVVLALSSVLLALVGVALFYLGVGRIRDARGPGGRA